MAFSPWIQSTEELLSVELDHYRTAWLLTLLSSLACVLGASILYIDMLLRRIAPGCRIADSQRFLASALGITSGTMLFSSLHLLLPASKRHLEQIFGPSEIHAYALFFLGILSIQLFNRLLHHLAPASLHCPHQDHLHGHDHDHDPLQEHPHRGGHHHHHHHGYGAVHERDVLVFPRTPGSYPSSRENSLFANGSDLYGPVIVAVEEGEADADVGRVDNDDIDGDVTGLADVEEEEEEGYTSTIGSGDGVFRDPRTTHWPAYDEETSTIYDSRRNSLIPHSRALHRESTGRGIGEEERRRLYERRAQGEEERLRLSRVSFQTALAVALHKFPEGMITFMGAATSPTLGIALCLGLLAHNVPEGMGVAVPMYAATGSRRRSFLIASLLTGGAQPLGALMGWWLLQGGSIDLVCGLGFGLTAGLMTSVVVDGVWPAALHAAGPRGQRLVAGSVIAGMGAIILGIIATSNMDHAH